MKQVEPGIASTFKVTVLGMGIVGSRVAQNLHRAGLSVRVWNRTQREELLSLPGWTENLVDAIQEADLIQVFVKDAVALGEMLDVILPVLKPGQIIAQHSTISLEATQQCAARVSEAGGHFLDAPFTGSKNAAADGKLQYYLSGDQAIIEKIRSVLELSSSGLHYFGEIGKATILKLATNMISATTVAILSESMNLIRAAGIPGEDLARAVSVNACQSGVSQLKLPVMVAGTSADVHFSLSNMLKDVRYSRHLGESFGVAMPVLGKVEEEMWRLEEKGFGNHDFSVLGIESPDKEGSEKA